MKHAGGRRVCEFESDQGIIAQRCVRRSVGTWTHQRNTLYIDTSRILTIRRLLRCGEFIETGDAF